MIYNLINLMIIQTLTSVIYLSTTVWRVIKTALMLLAPTYVSARKDSKKFLITARVTLYSL